MKKLLIRISISLLVLPALFLASPAAVSAQEMACEHTHVSIDVKPRSMENKINLSSHGLLPVALLTTEGFDASQFTPEIAHLSDASMVMSCEGAEAVRWTYQDVDGDGDLDLLFFFVVQELDLTAASTSVMLMAHGDFASEPIHIMGTDSVLVKP